jgi:hypothetical protein
VYVEVLSPEWKSKLAQKIANKLFDNVSQFKYLGTTVTDQNLVQEEIKRRLNSGNACYNSVYNHLSSCLLPKNTNIWIHNSTIFPVVLYGCEILSLTLSEELRLKVFENRMWRKIFWPKRDAVIGGCKKPHNEELHDLYSLPSVIGIIKSRAMRWAGHAEWIEMMIFLNIFQLR